MNLASKSLMVGMAALLGLVGAVAAQRAGVGYDPQARGLAISHYQLDTLGSAYLHHPVDFSANPGEVGANPNPYLLNFGDTAVRSAFERRYGPFTAGTRFKRWIGPGNEVKFLLRNALVWYFQNRPEQLGGDTSGRNGEPTEVEVTDVQALDDREIWIAYFQAELTGFSTEHRATICDPDRPLGDGEVAHPFWGIAYYYTNVYQLPLPVSPQPAGGLICPPDATTI